MEQIQKLSAELQVQRPILRKHLSLLPPTTLSVAPSNGVNYYLALQKNKFRQLSMFILPEDMAGDIGSFKYKQQWTQELEKWLRDGVVFPENPEPMLRIGKSYLGTNTWLTH